MRDPEFYQIKNGSTEERKYEGNEKNVHIENGKLTLNDLRIHILQLLYSLYLDLELINVVFKGGEEINAEYVCRSKNDHSKKIEYVKRSKLFIFVFLSLYYYYDCFIRNEFELVIRNFHVFIRSN